MTRQDITRTRRTLRRAALLRTAGRALAEREGIRTGEGAHPPLVYVLDAGAASPLQATERTDALVELLGRV